MTKSKKVVLIILASICIFGLAQAQEELSKPEINQTETFERPCCHRRPMGAGNMIGKVLHDQMLAEVLTELTGKTVSITDITRETVHDMLQTNAIQPDAFKTAMDAKTTILIQKMVTCGLITEAQASEMTQQMTQQADKQTQPAMKSRNSNTNK